MPKGSPNVSTKDATSSLLTAIHVLSTERAALAHLERLYQTDGLAQENLVRAVDKIVRTIQNGGKLVFCGVGKSGKIARKIEATMNSLGIFSMFLHPTEALHGDLGVIRENDTLLLISFSGRTKELLLFLPHIPPTVPIIAITSHTHPSTCPLVSFQSPDMAISLPAPIHEDEESSFGLSAPTSSTTVALALGDALALATAQRLHKPPDRGPAEVFKSFHPGGAIGAATAAMTPMSMLSTSPLTSTPSDYLQSRPSDDGSQTQQKQDVISNRFVPLNKIPTVSTTLGHETRLLDILLAAVQNPDAKSWVSISHYTSSTTSFTSLITPRHLHSLTTTHNVDMALSAISASGISVSVPQDQFLCVPASSPVDEVCKLVSQSDRVSVIAGVDETNPEVILGVLEAEELWSECH
ncbi:uncharacterized protein ASPGLDRAFT_65290 [Aspergillus glaucus CBS 516.65]|uniref:SIS domain-containing protein n=1 Tax=Aspergillus glaucus CBS 516.65 TaxID=1160497 RepID=A0A1L9VQG6_ASPGL|nr:hypothetical protein ASPGLDRAFT_65290 [Aspergillus glaucus CBS 516.65]OJJ86134.1 hypothetical protein ASPGLDRAFT_65290 [Aspergillus glaucus CBS 516.65]